MTSTPMPELKPCPFCGKTHTLKVTAASEVFSDNEGFYEHTETYAVMCNASKPNGPGGCGADGGFKADKADAITAWNTRAAIEAATEQGKPQWLPIADAPRDGTEFLAMTEEIDQCVLYWEEYLNNWGTGFEDSRITPTHWMPLPLPPTAAPQGKS